jgi:hypothetical protein
MEYVSGLKILLYKILAKYKEERGNFTVENLQNTHFHELTKVNITSDGRN